MNINIPPAHADPPVPQPLRDQFSRLASTDSNRCHFSTVLQTKLIDLHAGILEAHLASFTDPNANTIADSPRTSFEYPSSDQDAKMQQHSDDARQLTSCSKVSAKMYRQGDDAKADAISSHCQPRRSNLSDSERSDSGLPNLTGKATANNQFRVPFVEECDAPEVPGYKEYHASKRATGETPTEVKRLSCVKWGKKFPMNRKSRNGGDENNDEAELKEPTDDLLSETSSLQSAPFDSSTVGTRASLLSILGTAKEKAQLKRPKEKWHSPQKVWSSNERPASKGAKAQSPTEDSNLMNRTSRPPLVEGDEEAEWEEFVVCAIYLQDDSERKHDRCALFGDGSTSFNMLGDEADSSAEANRNAWDWALTRFVMAPLTLKVSLWELIGCLLILYDVATVPLSILGEIDDSNVRVFTCVYWTVSIFQSAFTGYLEEDGRETVRFTSVAIRYIKTWFILDIVSVFCDWAVFVLFHLNLGLGQSETALATGKLLRFLRMLRLVRVIRAAWNTDAVSKRFAFLVRNEEFAIVLSIVRLLFLIVVVTHFVACAWYGLGISEGVTWMQQMQLENESLGYRYAVAWNWALTIFAGSTDVIPRNYAERIFANVGLLIGIVILSTVFGSIATSMTRLQLLTAETSTQLSMLKRYLADNRIPAPLAARMTQSIQHRIKDSKRNTPESKVELLQLLSEPLRVELHYEMHGRVLQWYPFFACYANTNIPGFRQVCHQGVHLEKINRGDVVFSVGETPLHQQMFFVLEGKLTYIRAGASQVPVEPGVWACEAALWTCWTCLGVLRGVAQNCSLLRVDAEEFQSICRQFRTVAFYPAKYAATMVRALNKIDRALLTDLPEGDNIDTQNILIEVFGAEVALANRNTLNSHSSFIGGRSSWRAIVQSVSGRASQSRSWRSGGSVVASTSRSFGAPASPLGNASFHGQRFSELTVKNAFGPL